MAEKMWCARWDMDMISVALFAIWAVAIGPPLPAPSPYSHYLIVFTDAPTATCRCSRQRSKQKEGWKLGKKGRSAPLFQGSTR